MSIEQSLRPLIAELLRRDALVTVRRPVDPAADLGAVAVKAYREIGKGVRFDKLLNRAGWTATAQLLVEREQWAAAFGMTSGDVLNELCARLRQPIVPSEIAPAEAPITARRLDRSGGGLEDLPIPLCSAKDGGRQFTAVAIALDPDTGQDCLGFARQQIIAPFCAGIVDLSPALERLHRRHVEVGTAMPLALIVGASPALILAAALGTWRTSDMALAGGLAKTPLRRFAHPALGMPVPADAEILIAGTLSPTERCSLGPLANTLGLYSDAGDGAVFAATEISHRADPIFHAMHLGGEDDGAGALCLAAELLVAEHIRNIEGGIDFLDIRSPIAAGGLVIVVKLRGRVEGQVKTALLGALSGPANWPKLAIGVDEDVDAADLRDVFWSIASRTHAEIDIGMIDGVRAHPLDPASPLDGGAARIGTRWLIDSAMPPLSQAKRREDFARAIPKNLSATALSAFLPKS